jgi:hypothetical protein
MHLNVGFASIPIVYVKSCIIPGRDDSLSSLLEVHRITARVVGVGTCRSFIVDFVVYSNAVDLNFVKSKLSYQPNTE